MKNSDPDVDENAAEAQDLLSGLKDREGDDLGLCLWLHALNAFR